MLWNHHVWWYSIFYIQTITSIRKCPLHTICNIYPFIHTLYATAMQKTNGGINLWSWPSPKQKKTINSYQTFGHLKFNDIFFCAIFRTVEFGYICFRILHLSNLLAFILTLSEEFILSFDILTNLYRLVIWKSEQYGTDIHS